MSILRRLGRAYLQYVTGLRRICEECGASINHKRSDAIYCGDACLMRHGRRRQQRPINVGQAIGLPRALSHLRSPTSQRPGHLLRSDLQETHFEAIRIGRSPITARLLMVAKRHQRRFKTVELNSDLTISRSPPLQDVVPVGDPHLGVDGRRLA